ncbi:hypothetical protein Tco_1312700 [Tanacetum coccineum]
MPKSAWTEKDQIDNFLKERRLMRSLEKFVGGRLYEGDLRLLQKNHMILSYDVLIIQNRRDLPRDIPLDSVEVLRSILTDSKVTPTKHGRMTKPYSSPCFIANCFNGGYLKMEVKVPDSSCLKDS